MSGENIADGAPPKSFFGFESLEANFVFCPNQFFDIVIPNYSRPVVRLVSYVLHETLRWLDEYGQPIKQDIAISFNDLVTKAGIARGSIRKAIGEAVNAKLIKCVVKGRSKTPGEPGKVGEYSLAWDESGYYAKNIEDFAGFYLGQGNRSPIPHSFFSLVIPNETLAVTKVVATVLRFTVGYQNQIGGGRRMEAALPFAKMQRYACIASPATLVEAIRLACSQNYIRRVRIGRFTPNSDQQASTVYAVNWLAQAASSNMRSKYEAGHRYEIPSRESAQDQFKTRSGKRSGIEATNSRDAFKIRSTVKKIQNNQQTTDQFAAVESIRLLTKVGFTPGVARVLTRKATSTQIANQVAWLRYRTAKTNRLGLLRKAIEENWPEPTAAVYKRRLEDHWNSESAKEQMIEQSEQALQEERHVWLKRWSTSPDSIRDRCKVAALQAESNPIVRKRIEQRSINFAPHPNVMIVFQDKFKSTAT